jgi:2-phospho-L-lactate guanylyltransferase (CobY/MobA/RfbA family)
MHLLQEWTYCCDVEAEVRALPAVQPAHVNETPKSEHEAAVMLTPATKGGA